jgi:hypothetical protein
MPALQQEAARPRLVLPKLLKNTLCKKKRFPVISNLRYLHGLINIDEIKN